MSEEKTVRLTGNQLAQLANQERQKLNEVSQRIAQFRAFKNELMAAKDALEEISKEKKGGKIMVNLGAGIYTEASIENTKTAVSALAGNVFKDKPIPEIVKQLSKKIENIDKTIAMAAEEQQKAIKRTTQVENIISAGRKHLQEQQNK